MKSTAFICDITEKCNMCFGEYTRLFYGKACHNPTFPEAILHVQAQPLTFYWELVINRLEGMP